MLFDEMRWVWVSCTYQQWLPRQLQTWLFEYSHQTPHHLTTAIQAAGSKSGICVTFKAMTVEHKY
jgi:hypothetical protein